MNNLVTMNGGTKVVDPTEWVRIEKCTQDDYKPKPGQTNHYTMTGVSSESGGVFKMCASEPNEFKDAAILCFDYTLWVKITFVDGKLVAFLSSDGAHWYRHPDNFQLLDIHFNHYRFVSLLNPVYRMFFETTCLEG